LTDFENQFYRKLKRVAVRFPPSQSRLRADGLSQVHRFIRLDEPVYLVLIVGMGSHQTFMPFSDAVRAVCHRCEPFASPL